MKHKNNDSSEKHEPQHDIKGEHHDLHAELHDIQKELHGMKEQFEQLQKEKADIFSQLQRVSADYINYQKRISKQIADTTAYEKESIIKSLLPALDNFEHALAKAGEFDPNGAMTKGIQMVYDQIVDILKLHGIEQIKALGRQFDPEIPSAVTMISDPNQPDNIVLNESARGYKIGGRVIRPAKVVVNRISAPQPRPEQAESENEEPTTE
jgi:molecular chaperone GrpE